MNELLQYLVENQNKGRTKFSCLYKILQKLTLKVKEKWEKESEIFHYPTYHWRDLFCGRIWLLERKWGK